MTRVDGNYYLTNASTGATYSVDLGNNNSNEVVLIFDGEQNFNFNTNMDTFTKTGSHEEVIEKAEELSKDWYATYIDNVEETEESTAADETESTTDTTVSENLSSFNEVKNEFDNLDEYTSKVTEGSEDKPVKISYLDENGILQKKQENEYDGNGNITKKTLFTKDGTPIQKNEYTYDSNGNVTSEIQREYDANGKMVREVKLDGDGEVVEVLAYDGNGNIVERRQADGTVLINKQEIKHDVEKLEESTEHLGTDEEAIAEVMVKYAYAGQMDELNNEFGGDLLSELGDETKQDDAINMLEALSNKNAPKPYDVDTPEGLDEAVEALYDAMDGCGTDEDALIEILGNPNYSKREIQMIVEKYNEKHGDFKTKVQHETSGLFEDLLVERIDQAAN